MTNSTQLTTLFPKFARGFGAAVLAVGLWLGSSGAAEAGPALVCPSTDSVTVQADLDKLTLLQTGQYISAEDSVMIGSESNLQGIELVVYFTQSNRVLTVSGDDGSDPVDLVPNSAGSATMWLGVDVDYHIEIWSSGTENQNTLYWLRFWPEGLPTTNGSGLTKSQAILKPRTDCPG